MHTPKLLNLLLLLQANNGSGSVTGQSRPSETSLLLRLVAACLAEKATQIIIIVNMCVDDHYLLIWQNSMLCIAANNVGHTLAAV